MELIISSIFVKSAGAYYVIELLAHQTLKMCIFHTRLEKTLYLLYFAIFFP